MEVFNKLKQIKENSIVFDSFWKTNEQDVVRLLKHKIHPQTNFLHVRIHQDKNKRVEDLMLDVWLNIQVDKLVTENLSRNKV